MNKDEIDGVVNATAEIVKAVPVYQDAVQPVAKEMGRALGTLGGVINMALAPLSAMVYGYETIKQELTSRLEKRLVHTLPENIIAPKLQVVGPLLDKYKYVHDNEELSSMFVNLLSNAMDKDQVQKAHPSFVNVISELSPDEARLIKIISTQKLLPKIDINIKTKVNEKEGYLGFLQNFTLLFVDARLQYPDLTPSYLSNLERLMIIKCSSGSLQDSYVAEEVYRPLEEHEKIQAILGMSKEDRKFEITKGTIQITDFGKLFIGAVL
jgi:hypothetical protein